MQYYRTVVTKTGNDHKPPQTSTNDHKPPVYDQKPPANNHKPVENNHRQPHESLHHLIAGGFHPRQLFIIDTAGFLMKRETSLKYFTISVDKHYSHKLNKVNI